MSLSDFFSEIDSFLEQSSLDRIRLTISSWPIEKIRRQIIQRYEERGWKVTLHLNPLTGIWWVYLERKPKEEG